MKPVPTGTVAFLFTDIEGSTVRWEAYPDAMKAALRRHDALLRAAIEQSGGHVFKTIGDAFCVAFATVPEALAAAHAAQRALAASEWSDVDGVRVRMAIHAGSADERGGDYFGGVVNRVARLLATGHGGQVLLSSAAAQLVADALPEGLSLRDLGDHRLKDLGVPERVYQLESRDLGGDFPPLRSLDVVAHNLPYQVTSFVGRNDDLEAIDRALETSRLVTLCGPGGAGKTRLALQACATVARRFADGAWFVELAEITDPELVVREFAAVLRVPVLPGKSLTEAVAGTLNHQKTLLVVDNCEHVIGAAAGLIGTILRRAPGVHVIATSRQPLEISGEFVHRLAPLPLPPATERLGAEEARAYDSVKLFEERADAATSGFVLTDELAPVIAEICRSLDGMPLAIELAAPKLTLLSPRQLSNRLGERMRLLTSGKRTALRRQQTMRALIDWSHDLLDEREQTLFRQLAWFAGGWTLESAELVCGGAGLDESEVFDVLASLVAKSLVVADTSGELPRYSFLESIREYARERLASRNEEDATARRHAAYHANYVRAGAELSAAMDDRAWQARILTELDNIRLALDWALARKNDANAGLTILAHFRKPRLIFLPHEALHWFALGAQAAREAGDDKLAATVLAWHASANMYGTASSSERIAVAHAAVEAARHANEPALLGTALGTLGIALRDAGRLNEADATFREAADAVEAGGSAVDKADLYADWASNDLKRDDVARAREHLQTSLASARPGSMIAANALAILAEIEFASGDRERARRLAREAKTAFVALDARLDIGAVSNNLAAYAISGGDFDEARTEVAEALSILRGVGSLYLVISLEHFGVLAAHGGEHERAAHLLGFTDAAYASLGLVREGTERAGFERARELLLQHFGAEVFAERTAKGAAMDDEDALAYALEMEPAAGGAAVS